MDKELEQQLTKVFDNYAMAFEVDGRYSPLQWVCEVMSIINTEREISFKAGRKKVVKWVLANSIDRADGIFGYEQPHHCSTCDHSIYGVPSYLWQAQLKEWGLLKEEQ